MCRKVDIGQRVERPVSDAAVYRENADKLLELALRTENEIERGHLISVAAQWHMRAADLERGGPLPGLDDLDFELDPRPPAETAGDEPEA